MINDDKNSKAKITVILEGNSFRYEVEAILKLFFGKERFNFVCSDDFFGGSPYISAGISRHDGVIKLYATVALENDVKIRDSTQLPYDSSEDLQEHELCRLLYDILRKITGISPPWGLMTGIRPVKKFTKLMSEGKSYGEIKKILTEKYEISGSKFDLAFRTASNQLPLLTRQDKKSVGLYVSVPFCPSRCSYCSFVSHSMNSALKLIPDYIDCLCQELEVLGKTVREAGMFINTVYFGGGTPSVLSPEEIEKIMLCVSKNFDTEYLKEYSFEAGRPDTITKEKLSIIKKCGADRISINPQTLNDNVLNEIGRKHTSKDFMNAYELARKMGFDNINTDIIAGLPGDDFDGFRDTLDKIIDLDPESITVHTLTLKRSSDLFADENSHICTDTSEMVTYSADKLISYKYEPYYLYRQKNTVDNLENVGYAKKGYESFYNICIMDESQTILGAGCAASTKLVYPDGKIRRIHNYKFPYEYIKYFDRITEKKKEISECLKKISIM